MLRRFLHSQYPDQYIAEMACLTRIQSTVMHDQTTLIEQSVKYFNGILYTCNTLEI